MDEEAELEHRQGGTLYTVGKALRTTFDAENHHTLGRDVTGLMLDLARVPTDQPALPPASPPPLPSSAARPRPGIATRVRAWLVRTGD